MKNLLPTCENCGCQRKTPCKCKKPNPNSQTQRKKQHRKELGK